MKSKLEKLISRICLYDENGNEMIYFYNREGLNVALELIKGYDGYFIEKGGKIKYDKKEYEVQNVVFKLYPETYNPGYGVSGTPEITESSEYNVQIGVFLKAT